MGTLTNSKDAGAYWRKLKQRLKEEGSEIVTFCHGLKMLAADGKMRETDAADMQGIFRIIQSVSSPKAEPFKMWLAETATKDITESSNPQGLEENKKAAKRGGNVAKVARETLEKETGELVITPKNAIDFGRLISDVAKELTIKADKPKENE